MSAEARSQAPAAVLSREQLTRLRMTLGRLGRVLRQQTDDGLSYALISLLLTIYRLQPVTPGELALSEGVSPPSVTRSLSRLLDLGMVVREQDPADGRASLVSLTAAGLAERENLLRTREVWLSEHLRRLSHDEIEALLTALPALERLCDPELETDR